MDQNICCGIIEEEAVGESQFLNHVGSRRIGRSEVRHAESSAVLVRRPTAICCFPTHKTQFQLQCNDVYAMVLLQVATVWELAVREVK
jgi:hypothetical protein